MSVYQRHLPFSGSSPVTREMATWAGRTLRLATDAVQRAIAGFILAMWRHHWKRRSS